MEYPTCHLDILLITRMYLKYATHNAHRIIELDKLDLLGKTTNCRLNFNLQISI